MNRRRFHNHPRLALSILLVCASRRGTRPSSKRRSSHLNPLRVCRNKSEYTFTTWLGFSATRRQSGRIMVLLYPLKLTNRYLSIAVGTTICRLPPHGPGRALLGASGSYLG